MKIQVTYFVTSPIANESETMTYLCVMNFFLQVIGETANEQVF